MSLAGFKSSNHPQQVAKRGATDRDNLGTDPALFRALDERFRFTLDVAATLENAKCGNFFTKDENGLALPWASRVWCNPPYSQIREWVDKAWVEWFGGNVKVIDARFPGVPNLGDLTAVDWSEVEPVDVVTAGYPCQPFQSRRPTQRNRR